jgi:hypothetical protein
MRCCGRVGVDEVLRLVFEYTTSSPSVRVHALLRLVLRLVVRLVLPRGSQASASPVAPTPTRLLTSIPTLITSYPTLTAL